MPRFFVSQMGFLLGIYCNLLSSIPKFFGLKIGFFTPTPFLSSKQFFVFNAAALNPIFMFVLSFVFNF